MAAILVCIVPIGPMHAQNALTSLPAPPSPVADMAGSAAGPISMGEWRRAAVEPFLSVPSVERFIGVGHSFKLGAALNPWRSGSSFNRFGSASLSDPLDVHPSNYRGPTHETLALPSLSQLMHGAMKTPFGVRSAGHSTRWDSLRPDDPIDDFNRVIASALFTSTDLGNGVLFSAGTGFGGHTNVGAPPSSLGGAGGGVRHSSGPSVAVKLSF